MRGLALLALCALMALSSLFILGGGPEGSPDAESTLGELQAVFGSSEEAAAEGGEVAADVAAAPTSSFFQYTDDQGRTHFVQNAGDVPGRYRKSADALEIRSRIIRPERTPEQQTRPAGRRAFAYDPDAETTRAQAGGDVVIYTAPWCGWCRKTLAWLDSNDVDYDNRDIEANPTYRDELIAKTGATSIPMVEIGGQVIRGYSPARMTQLLEL